MILDRCPLLSKIMVRDVLEEPEFKDTIKVDLDFLQQLETISSKTNSK